LIRLVELAGPSKDQAALPRVVVLNRSPQFGQLGTVIRCPIRLVEIEQLGVEAEDLVVPFGDLIARLTSWKFKALGTESLGETRFGGNVIMVADTPSPVKATIGMVDNKTLLSSQLFHHLRRAHLGSLGHRPNSLNPMPVVNVQERSRKN
jgi:hypothetical protein